MHLVQRPIQTIFLVVTLVRPGSVYRDQEPGLKHGMSLCRGVVELVAKRRMTFRFCTNSGIQARDVHCKVDMPYQAN